MTSVPPTFAARWSDTVAAHPHAPFLIWEAPDGHVTRWTYAEFDALVARVAGGLLARGVGPGDRIGIALRNCPAYVALWLALARLGAAMVCSDPSARTPELAAHLRRTRARLGFCAPERAADYRAAASETGTTVVEVAEDDTDLAILLGRPTPVGAYPPGPADLAGLMFTSGTTAEPKCVMVTQANYAFAGAVMAVAAELGPADRQFVVLPMFHANAQYYSFAAAITVGASVVLLPAFSASRFVAQAARHEVTHLSLFAAPIRMILARTADRAAPPGLRVRHCWYAQNVTDDQYERFATLLGGCRPRQLYGMTETIPAVLSNPAGAPVSGSMGRPTPGCVVAVHDAATGEPATDGEIVVGGEPGVNLFAGYLDDPAATAAAYRDGWFVTGDRARVDRDGHFHFAGRRGDVLKVAGENVSVVEIEAVLAEHPAVLEAAVVGAPDDVRDEVPVAFVVAVPEAGPTALDDLADWCADRLAKSKRPVRFERVAELPRTSVGKIRKFLLTERIAP
ncbi:class I adenylate-forming enzyme family protein [Embleya scabrispora]|uniref:class I adenylate-forming enzyme family protein n=1 Tax=Embleya scabrispora TaxID=159449 RepID=UPI0003780120|nr:AMP-binding protein [Embleya scabrispora]MYS80843.1 AMP-binding protein [Streptomyces sp. SID5474]